MKINDYVMEIEDYDLEYFCNSCGMAEQEIGAYYLLFMHKGLEKVAEIMGIEVDEAERLSKSAWEKLVDVPESHTGEVDFWTC